jgi:putative hydrolase of the HAD superfamily
MKTSNQLIVFDGDDTLWSTMPLYDIAKERFANCVASLIPSAAEAVRRLDEIDHANVAILGFSTERFPRSMVEAYRVICHEAGRPPEPEAEAELLEAGRAVFTSPVVTFPDAEDTLTRLVSQFDLVLATKGDLQIQAERVVQSRLRHFFSEIHILAKKTEEEFLAILAAHTFPPSSAWSIGNSVRSDINPALRAGLSAVLIPRTTWQFEDEPLMESPRLFVKQTLSEAADLVIDRCK